MNQSQPLTAIRVFGGVHPDKAPVEDSLPVA
jgi:hypothetical protein